MSILLSSGGLAPIVPSSVRRLCMIPTITAFAQSPDRGQGLARDMAVRWALEADRPWHAERLSLLDERVRIRLHDLSRWLTTRSWLEEAFGAADIVMVTVLRRLGGSGLLEEQPTIASYVARGEARSASGRAFEAKRAVFTAAAGAT
jgi:glutathione S-transferase